MFGDCFHMSFVHFQGLAELKELAGLDKDLDEEEDLGMLEKEATMPLRELLLKMKEVGKNKYNV